MKGDAMTEPERDKKLRDKVLEVWANNKAPARIYVRDILGEEATGLYLSISQQKAVWAYDRKNLKTTLAVFIFKVTDEFCCGCIGSAVILDVKKFIDGKLDELKSVSRNSSAVIQQQALLIQKQQTELDDMKKRLAALEAKSIERDLGAPA